MVIEIFSRLNLIDASRKWTLVCREFRDLILSSPIIMRRLLILFKYKTQLEEVLTFLNNYGTTIKNLRFRNLYLAIILEKTINLGEIEYDLYDFH